MSDKIQIFGGITKPTATTPTFTHDLTRLWGAVAQVYDDLAKVEDAPAFEAFLDRHGPTVEQLGVAAKEGLIERVAHVADPMVREALGFVALQLELMRLGRTVESMVEVDEDDADEER